MANLKAEFAKNPLKIAGGVLFCFGSVWLFIHMLPHREYVTAHADRPRPKAAVEAPAAVQPVAKAAAAPRPSQRASSAPAAVGLSGKPLAPVRVEANVSTSPTVASIYTADHLRDPFARWGASRGPARPFSIEDFSIHKLFLRGIMRDSGADFALLVDNEAGVGFLLRKGRLYDPKKKAVPGVAGTINFKNKVVTLTAPEGDVQVFRLGEEEKD
jgi:hypothetical protein